MTNPRRTALIAGVAGAALVGVAWLALDGSNGSTTKKLTAPARLGGLARYTDVPLSRTVAGRRNAMHSAATDRRSAELLSQAYDGAAATVQRYSDDNYATTAYLMAVRAPSPPPYVLYEDVKYLRVVRPFQEVLRFGDVACLVQNDDTLRKKPAPDSVYVLRCQRSDGKLTVALQPGGDPITHQPARDARMVDEAWADLA